MPLTLGPEYAQAIDTALWRIYGSKLHGGELSQLAKLFGKKGLPNELVGVLRPSLRHGPYYREELEIKLAWIDKRPLAELAAHSKRVELGDAAFFYFEQLRHRSQVAHQFARALIVQAKVAKEENQIARPIVPVNPARPAADSSTARELDLLSRWDPFDLYATSASIDAMVTGIAIAPDPLPPAHAWYMATPKRHPKKAQTAIWKSPWMCGPAEYGAVCSFTLGALLRAFLTFAYPAPKGELPIEAGASFNFSVSELQKPSGRGWDRLCIELLRLCPSNQFPRSLFGNLPDRSAVVSAVIRSLPYIGGGATGWGWLRAIYEWLFPHRMPVLLVVLIKTEGE